MTSLLEQVTSLLRGANVPFVMIGATAMAQARLSGTLVVERPRAKSIARADRMIDAGRAVGSL